MDLFEVGEIVKTRGLCGCLKILSYLKSGNKISKPDVVYIEKTPGQKNRFCLNKMEQSRNALFIELEGINDVNSAGHLIGGRVYFSKDVLKKLPAGEYYVHEIIGLDVYSDAGDYLGKIESVFPTGSNDVYVCRKAKEEILLPAISDVIKRIDLDQRIMTVKIPDGL
ncbi:MAG TPA: ribosome maturation factor RimM [Smithella sp.]|jgi:16S rRNA processing protein RimM|nr:ribosome maturation factor RimM [Smithella sp.]